MKPPVLSRAVLLFLAVFIVSCSAGKRSLEKGNYDQAVYKAVNRLQKDTDNRKALRTLGEAYGYATGDHMDNIREAKLSSDILRWERVIGEYQAMNALIDEIKRCPSCRTAVQLPEKYTREVAEAKENAAAIRYARGLKLLEEKNRQSAKQAYYDFEKAEELSPGYKDVIQKLDEAYWAAVIKVVVEPVQLGRSIYQYSNEYFQNKIYEYLENYEQRSFIKFYTPREARRQDLIPDQVLSLNFDDFVVGQTYVKEKVEEVKRDSVKVGTAEGKDVYGTVKAKVSIFEKTVSSGGLLNVMVTDWHTKNTITQERMEGTYVWQTTWGSYKGDERALRNEDKSLIKRRETLPPPPQELFIEFTKPLYAQLTDKIRRFYSKY
ncbi:hypothetical protein GZH53_13375 [Flavihumibacter sp. R14]|nr:hypothetical protein [Flavihumibacter soli]